MVPSAGMAAARCMMARAYYNEFDPYAAQWLRNLIAAGHIAPGDVDERSIVDVRPDDLRGYTQVHFFAGIGGWSLALRLAGWPDDRPVWTGSCPCQPFSAAGKRGGFDDERHLWPVFRNLIRECRPPVVMGEQVASKDGLAWLDAVHADLQAAGYAAGAVDWCAAGVGAPHIRQRLWWVGERLENTDPAGRGLERGLRVQRQHVHDPDGRGEDGGLADADEERREMALQHDGSGGAPDSVGGPGGPRMHLDAHGVGPGPLDGFWRGADWLLCRDGRWRPVEPGTFPLAHGVSGRVGRLRAYGNAVVPQVAAEVIAAFMDVNFTVAVSSFAKAAE
jgi:DNA (cytosine-5)-methyltransferase 1